jgi:hypothetical protein
MKLSGLIFLFSLILIFNFNLNNAQPVPDKATNDVDIIIPDENGKIAGRLVFWYYMGYKPSAPSLHL